MSLETVWQKEIATQKRVVKLFQDKLGYEYLGDWSEGQRTSPIESDMLSSFLESQWYSQNLISKALYELEKVAWDSSRSLYDVNKDVYQLLRYGIKVKEEAWENKQTVWLVDYNNIENNHFAIAEEVTVRWQHTKRPDIVIYVNGIALWVIELKRSKVSVTEWIRQNLDNQKEEFIQNFFTAMQFVFAWNDTEGLKYWTIETPEKYYLTWKEESDIENILDRSIYQMCDKSRLIEMLHDFVVYDKWRKKLCRVNQYFWIKEAQKYLHNNEWWIIWHTQGSWKSLTMVWLAKWIKENLDDSRVLVVTDREELDSQIEKVFSWVDEQIYRTTSWRDLISTLNVKDKSLICSLVHKFWWKKDTDVDDFLNELKSSLPKDFEAKGNIYVFVDECHRTQSGKLHDAMKMILPNAVFVGFTWTPLLKKDKQKSIEVFGRYIHTYKFDEAVKDKVVLDLVYEARDIDQTITSPDRIDQWFEAKTRWLTDYALSQLKRKWWTLQQVLSSKSRLEKIVSDILFDFETKDRLQNWSGNALLVAGSIYEACKYYELFQSKWFKRCAIISSYDPSVSSIKWETVWWDEETESIEKYEIYNKMLNWQDSEEFERVTKEKFINEPGQMKLLIVVDKLLTGFDAPSATYLYIDKSMRDHGLFQAITRVNRLDWDSKEYGYVIDYKDLFKKVEWAIWDYTSEAFDQFEAEDVKGLLTDRLEVAKQRLDESLESIKALCEWVWPERTTASYMHYFCWKNADAEELKANEQKRHTLYKYTVSLIRSYANIANEMQEAWYNEWQIGIIKRDVKFYTDLRDEIKLASGDYIDLKSYEPAMRHLIDSYIVSSDSQKVSAFHDKTLLELIVERWSEIESMLPEKIKGDQEAMAETIENNVRKLIIDELEVNHRYYEKMSKLLDDIIKQRKENALEYQEYLQKITMLAKDLVNREGAIKRPASINTPAKESLYDNLWEDEELVAIIHDVVVTKKQDDFRWSSIKQRALKIELKKTLQTCWREDIDIDELFEIIKNQKEY